MDIDSILDFFEEKIKIYIVNLIGKQCEVEYRYGGQHIRFSRKIGERDFVLQITVSMKNYNYISLTNLLLPPSMKGKGVSIEIINMLVSLCNENGFDLFVTEITNEAWQEGLKRHGGVEDSDGDIQINKNVWVKQNKPKKLKFNEYQDELIEESELEGYKKLKEVCIAEAIRIYNSWGTEVKIKDSKGYIEEIRAIKGEETFGVRMFYSVVVHLMTLRSKNKLEEYLKESQFVGFGF